MAGPDSSGVPAVAIVAVAGGGLLLWSGLKGANITSALRSLISGQAPAATDANPVGTPDGGTPGTPAAPGSVSETTPGSGTAKANAALGMLMAAAYGWTGAQWTALNNVAMRESGWSATARNPGGAYGIAQALGHGNANTRAADGINEYGGYGVTDATAKAANGGSAAAQIAWMLSYIKQTYGTPEGAWESEQSRGYY